MQHLTRTTLIPKRNPDSPLRSSYDFKMNFHKEATVEQYVDPMAGYDAPVMSSEEPLGQGEAPRLTGRFLE